MTTPSNPLLSKLAQTNENMWMRFGALCENMHDPEKALYCYENSLRHNLYNVKALTQAASICRMREQYPKAVEYFQRILNVEQTNGEIWGALGHCYLMMDDLQKAYTAYQQALYHLPNPKDPNLWYGIGILYDRYGSFEHAEEAFTAVLKMDPKFEKANEIYFRLGIIYKQQMKHEQALDCFRYILQKPPRPLVQADIWFQIGHVYELQKDFHSAKDAYERVLKENPTHAKVLQQLGWLYHHNTTFGNQEIAISYLMRSIDADPSDGQTWYLLGRCYMAQQKYRKAYDAYQQAVYRDGRNPTFWCSIGVLYYQINQYRDALDAYSRAIRLNPYLSEVWYDLGTLYESCNQISDSLDAYQRAAELDPNNKHIQQRLSMLRAQISGGGKPAAANAKDNTPTGPGGEAGLGGSSGKGEADAEKASAADMEKPGPMEPRTSSAPGHALSEGMGALRRPPATNGALPVVADLVDLSRDEKPRLPSATELNSSLSDVKTQQKSAQDEDTKPVQTKPSFEREREASTSNDNEKPSRDTEMREMPPLRERGSEVRIPPRASTKDDDYYDREDDGSDKEGKELRISDSQTIEPESSSTSATSSTSLPPPPSTTTATTTTTTSALPKLATPPPPPTSSTPDAEPSLLTTPKENNGADTITNYKEEKEESSIERPPMKSEERENAGDAARGIDGGEIGQDQPSKKRKGISDDEGEMVMADGSNSESDSEKSKKLKSSPETKKRK